MLFKLMHSLLRQVEKDAIAHAFLLRTPACVPAAQPQLMNAPLDDPFEMYRQLPSHQQRLAVEKKVNCYFIPGRGADGGLNYIYAVCSAMLHDVFVAALKLGEVPDFAVVVEMGLGEPTAEVKRKIMEYYGFDHDAA